MKNQNLLIASIFVLTFLGISYLGLADNLEQNQLIDSIKSLNERLIKVETMQNSYSNNIALVSISMTVFITLFTIVVGSVIYLSNKKNVDELKSSLIEITNLNTKLADKQKAFETFVEENKLEINRIISEQDYYHYEIFNNLSSYLIDKTNAIIGPYNKIAKILYQSKSITFLLIASKKLPKYKNYKRTNYIEVKENNLNILEIEITKNFNINSNTIISNSEKSTLINNLEDSIDFLDSDDNFTKTKIQSLIEMVKSYKASDETEEKS